jgi:hypothetical protein
VAHFIHIVFLLQMSSSDWRTPSAKQKAPITRNALAWSQSENVAAEEQQLSSFGGAEATTAEGDIAKLTKEVNSLKGTLHVLLRRLGPSTSVRVLGLQPY